MTKEQAKQAMRDGNKVTHRHFSPDEWVTMVGDQLKLEDGVVCYPDEFWRWRTDKTWDDGWDFFTDLIS